MTTLTYQPTEEQQTIIGHDGDAFVQACPGSGKTRTMVERARFLLTKSVDRRGVAFLSFTNAAVDELERRLRSFGLLPSPLFPSFIGTFDRFLWQFFIVPFGVDGCDQPPRLMRDKAEWEIKPYATAQPLPLKCFNRATGTILPSLPARLGFLPERDPSAWERTARQTIKQAHVKGYIDFEDVRECVASRLANKVFAARLGAALHGRFREIVVDEAQDCNREDLEIIRWLRDSGIRLKVICDANQAIYAFRGGATDELIKFAESFARKDQLTMTGNFRSSPAICAAISQLRPPATRGVSDKAVGKYQADTTPVYMLSYGGAGVPASIGDTFHRLASGLGIAAGDAPVLAGTRASAGNAVGRGVPDAGNDKTLLLAAAVMRFHFSFSAGNRAEALDRLHCVILQVRGIIANAGEYSRHVTTGGSDDGRWRPGIIEVGQALKLRPRENAGEWLARARKILCSGLRGPSSINQRLKSNAKLELILAEVSPTALPAKTIHSVKGLEFPAVCVVLTPPLARTILDVLSGATSDPGKVEEARKIYVAASRAERLMALAVPRSCAPSLNALLSAGGQRASIIDL